MSVLTVTPIHAPFDVVIEDIAADKSISHRSAMFAMLSQETSTIKNYLPAEDTLNTLRIVSQLGAVVKQHRDEVVITPPTSIKEPDDILYCGNSGTAIRLFCGLLSAQTNSVFILNGDRSIRGRPMRRIIDPLNSNGACIVGRQDNSLAPLTIQGKAPYGFTYQTPVASAQIKSALILYALFGKVPSTITEQRLSRNHTELMLQAMGANITTTLEGNGGKTVVSPISLLKVPLKPLHITIPADPSSAFFFAVAAAITKGAKITLKHILLNETRIEAFRVLQRMGAAYTV